MRYLISILVLVAGCSVVGDWKARSLPPDVWTSDAGADADTTSDAALEPHNAGADAGDAALELHDAGADADADTTSDAALEPRDAGADADTPQCPPGYVWCFGYCFTENICT